jgi:hypothetical protein
MNEPDAASARHWLAIALGDMAAAELVDLIATARLVVDAATAFLRECGLDLNGVTPR